MKSLLVVLTFLLVTGTAYAAAEVTRPLNDGYTDIRRTTPPGTPAGNLTYTPLEPLPGTEGKWYSQPDGLGLIFNAVFSLLLTLGALFAVGMLVFGGIAYMTQDATGAKDMAKKRMTSAIYGLLLLIGSALILRTIDPNLLVIKIQPGAIKQDLGYVINSQTKTSGPVPVTNDEKKSALKKCEEQNKKLRFAKDGSTVCM